MIRRPPRSTRTDTLLPYTTLFRSPGGFWEKPLRLVDMIDVGLRSNYVASYYAAPLMVAATSGWFASISFYGAVSYFHGAADGAAKAGTYHMQQDRKEERREGTEWDHKETKKG